MSIPDLRGRVREGMNCAPSQFPIGGKAREGWSEALKCSCSRGHRPTPQARAMVGAQKACKPQDPVKLRGRRYSPDGRRPGRNRSEGRTCIRQRGRMTFDPRRARSPRHSFPSTPIKNLHAEATENKTHHRGHRDHGEELWSFPCDLRVLCGECFLGCQRNSLASGPHTGS